MSCPFCENQEIKDRTIHKGELVMAFPSNTPITPGHILVCPVRHVSKLDDLTDEEWISIRNLILRIKNALGKSLDAEGFNIAWNEGRVAGQTVDHLHAHVVPRGEGDSGIYEYEPRKFLYRPGERGVSPEEELREIAVLIKKAFDV